MTDDPLPDFDLTPNSGGEGGLLDSILEPVRNLLPEATNMMDLPPTWLDSWDRAGTGSSGKPSVSPDSRHAILDLQQKVERQHLFIQTLLRLLMEKGLIQENEFREWLTFVDGFDGNLDGKLRPDTAPQGCPSCGRKSPATYPRCQYCGADFVQPVLETDRRKS